jgi:hypothetical protein
MYRTVAIIHALLLWEPRNEKASDVNTHHVETNSVELLTMSVGHLLDWNSTFSALGFRAYWITGTLLCDKCSVFISMCYEYSRRHKINNSKNTTIRATALILRSLRPYKNVSVSSKMVPGIRKMQTTSTHLVYAYKIHLKQFLGNLQ